VTEQLHSSPSKSTPERPEGIIPISPGYVCVPVEHSRSRSNGPAPRLPVIGVALRTDGSYHAVVLDMDGRAQFSAGPVYVEGPSHDETSSSKALQEVAQALKALVAIKQKPPAVQLVPSGAAGDRPATHAKVAE
jgi:hypothetical protein